MNEDSRQEGDRETGLPEHTGLTESESRLAGEQKIRDLQKQSFRKGVRRGALGGVIVCALVVFAGGMIANSRSDTTTLSVTVTDEDGNETTETQTYDSVLDAETVDKINYLAAYIQAYYYEDVDEEELQQGLFEGLFSSLDAYSTYYSEEEYEEIYSETISGSYSGIGATLQQDADTYQVTVIQVQEGSPAEEAGIEEGDIITEADGYEAADMELSEFVTHIKGEEGTSVSLTIYRPDEDEYIELEVTRETLDIETVSWDMLEDETGYIAISEFSENTTDQFVEAVEELQSEGMENLIVDLRDNPGGTLTSVVEILQYIVPEGLIVYTEDKYGCRDEYRSTGEYTLDIPLVVLVNENSASASEIFAGAVKDRDCGTLLGTTTYGKGVVQGLQELTDGSALKLTTSRYYTPDGVCIQGTGIEPDVELEYEFLGSEDDDYDYSLDNQIQAALELLEEEE